MNRTEQLKYQYDPQRTLIGIAMFLLYINLF